MTHIGNTDEIVRFELRTQDRLLRRRRVLGAVVGLVVLASALGACGHHLTRATASRVVAVNDIAMASARVGWGVTSGDIWRTTNGARAWRKVTPPGVSFRIISGNALNVSWDFVSADTAWVISAESTDNAFLISRTTDGGFSWRQFRIVLGNGGHTRLPPPYQVDFISPRVGWLSLSTGAAGPQLFVDLFETQDGGHMWRLVYQTKDHQADVGGLVSFDTTSLGWLLPAPIAAQAPRVTTDGGRSWQPIVLHGPGNTPAQPAQGVVALAAPTFGTHNRHGQIPVVLVSPRAPNERVGVVVSSSGGRQWEPVASTVVASVRTPLLAQTIGAHLAWFVASGRLWRSTNAGRSFVSRSSAGFLVHVTGMEFINQEIGWLWTWSTTSQARIWMTTSGGRYWSSWIPRAGPM